MKLLQAAHASRFWLDTHAVANAHVWGPVKIYSLSQRIIPDRQTWNSPRHLAFYNTLQPTNKILWHNPLHTENGHIIGSALKTRLTASTHFSHAIPANTVALLDQNTESRLWNHLPEHGFIPFITAHTLHLSRGKSGPYELSQLHKNLLTIMHCQADIPLVPLDGLERPIANFVQMHSPNPTDPLWNNHMATNSALATSFPIGICPDQQMRFMTRHASTVKHTPRGASVRIEPNTCGDFQLSPLSRRPALLHNRQPAMKQTVHPFEIWMGNLDHLLPD